MISILSSIFNVVVLSLVLLSGSVGCTGSVTPQGSAGEPALETGSRLVALSEADTDRKFRSVMQRARTQRLHSLPMGEIKQAVAEQFLGTPYEAGMLDKSDQETLVISLTGFDCVLFNETVLALAQGIAVQDYSYEGFTNRIRDLRYRGGVLDGYHSRLHYFSEWILDNEKRGHVRNITQDIGGKPLDKQLTFMSAHRSSYRQLGSEANYRRILEVERNLRGLELFFIPQDDIHTVYDQLHPGDIIATATDIDGLDVTHTGLVYRNSDGSTGFIHASLSGEVLISPNLQAYVKGVSRQIGIIVARPADPRASRAAHQ